MSEIDVGYSIEFYCDLIKMIFKSINYSHNVELTKADVQNVVNVEMCKCKYI